MPYDIKIKREKKIFNKRMEGTLLEEMNSRQNEKNRGKLGDENKKKHPGRES